MQETLEQLPGEEEIRIVKQKYIRMECEYCKSPAHFKYAFLYQNFRSNPASKAYRRDDCTWCSDIDVFVCRKCKPIVPKGCDAGATVFPANEKFAHMFLKWVTLNE